MFFLPTLFVVSLISLSIFSPSLVLGLTITTMNSSDESTRETLKPWSDRWTNKRIGFHLKEVNPVLLNHASALLPAQDGETCDAKTKIFVPLCGKAIDVAYLATSLSSASSIEVVGLEGIRVALEEFIDEHPDLKISKDGIPGTSEVPFERFVGDSVSLWKGDYFDLLEPSEKLQTSIGTFEAIYDRASIVAIEPEMREKYVRTLDSLLKVGGTILLVALERVATPEKAFATKIGPPFSIPEDTIRALFADVVGDSDEYSYHVEILQQTDQLVEKPEDRERFADLDKLLETVYLIRKQGN
mmetsp:Transcript_4305/g.8964  ORF Transcript_4305/g.8964 Transcript_4305/m.8964 type:complete len:300 (-) Transcript_4305:1487-2386(-)